MSALKRGSILVLLCTAALFLCACGTESGYKVNSQLAASGKVRLTLIGMNPDFRAMESVISKFCTIYPNCSIEYEYVQNYGKTLPLRLADREDRADLFITTNIQADSTALPYALELLSQGPRLNISQTYSGLIENFTYGGRNGTKLYAVPMDGELRGLYVNTTLLSSLGLKVPRSLDELIACCERLKKAGYVPFQGNPGSFGIGLLYPYICSLVANSPDYPGTYSAVNACEPGISNLFRPAFEILYGFAEKHYYDYKYIESSRGAFANMAEDTMARDFLNIVLSDGNYKKADDRGLVAFLPGTLSWKGILDRTKEDFHSAIEYKFILAPVSSTGGYAYLSPGYGIAVSSASLHRDWALEFLNFFFTGTVNRDFARQENGIPNTKDALDYIRREFRISPEHICQLGQVTFDYPFYQTIREALIDVSKANNPKYMKKDGTMYELQHYMDNLEKALAQYRR